MSDDSGAAVSAYWTKAGAGFDSRASHVRHKDAWQKALKASFGPGESRDVLDLGTGTGACAIAAARMGHRVVAVDGSPGMLSGARQAADAEGLAIRFVEARFEAVPFEPASFDVVTLRNVLWTLPKPIDALKTARSVLRDDGRLVVSDGLWSQSSDRADYDAKLADSLPYHGGLTENDARALLLEAGFSAVQSWQHLFSEHPYETMGSPSFFLLSARCN